MFELPEAIPMKKNMPTAFFKASDLCRSWLSLNALRKWHGADAEYCGGRRRLKEVPYRISTIVFILYVCNLHLYIGVYYLTKCTHRHIHMLYI